MLPTMFLLIQLGGFREEDLTNIGQSELSVEDEMSNIYRRPSKDASYQISVHLAKRFQRRFKKIGQSDTRIACGGHVR